MNSVHVIAMALCLLTDLTSAGYVRDYRALQQHPNRGITTTYMKHPDSSHQKQYANPPAVKQYKEYNDQKTFWGPGYEELQRHLPTNQQFNTLEDEIPHSMKKLFGIVLKFNNVCLDERIKMFKELGEIFKENVRAEDAERTRLKQNLIDFLVKAASIVALEKNKPLDNVELLDIKV